MTLNKKNNSKRKGNPTPPDALARLQYVTCAGCGKRGYFSRANAKAARKSMGKTSDGQPLKTYPCPDTPGMYHVGRLHAFDTREEARNYHFQKRLDGNQPIV